MLILVLVVVWAAVLAPILYRRFRDQDTDRSIINFHERMARLGSGDPLVEPAHRLSVNDETPPRELLDHEVNPPTRAPRLRVVPNNATTAQLERDQSWDEWSNAYSDDPIEVVSPERHAATRQLSSNVNRRAAAYSRVPAATVTAKAPPSSYGSRPQRVRRRRVLLSLTASTSLSTVAILMTSSFIVELWALGSWLMMLSFLGLMYYAMSVGMMSNTARPTTRLVNPRATWDDESVEELNEFDAAYQPRERRRSSFAADRYARAL